MLPYNFRLHTHTPVLPQILQRLKSNPQDNLVSTRREFIVSMWGFVWFKDGWFEDGCYSSSSIAHIVRKLFCSHWLMEMLYK